MPGIFGYIAKRPLEVYDRRLELMLDSMSYDSTYIADTYTHEPLGLSLGWINRANCNGSLTAIWNSDRSRCLILLGEESTYKPSGSKPMDSEHRKSILVAFEADLESALYALNGWFCGIYLDTVDNCCYLFNDRYGMSRVYYQDTDDAIYFASEAKAILAASRKSAELDFQSVGEFFSCGCALENRTLFKHIHLLEGGSLWKIRKSGHKVTSKYFSPSEWESLEKLPAKAHYDKLLDTFKAALSKTLDGDVAVSLTGGVDSRMIMAWAPNKSHSLPTYSFGGPIRECYDTVLGRRIAQACNQSHTTLRFDDDFFLNFGNYVEQTIRISDGAMNASGAVELYMNRKASAIAPIRLTGNYGGEILRSSIAFGAHLPEIECFNRDFIPHIFDCTETFQSQLDINRLSFIAFKQVPWHHYARLSIEQSQVAVRTPYLDNDLVKCCFQAPSEHITSKEPSLRIIANGNPALSKIPTDRGQYIGQSKPMLNTLHRKLIHFGVKAEYACDYGMPHWFVPINRILKIINFENFFLGRNKFYHFRSWYQSKLSDYIKSVLLDPKSLNRSYLKKNELENIVLGHTKNKSNHTTLIHHLLAIELAQQLFIDK